MFHSSLNKRVFKEQGTVVKLNFVGLEKKKTMKINVSRGCICV